VQAFSIGNVTSAAQNAIQKWGYSMEVAAVLSGVRARLSNMS